MKDSKEYFGNYLGLCINNDDPEKRGRVQVFIPHVLPALFDDWNAVGADIQILGVGDNIPGGLNAKTVQKLIKILPWAECAAPIIGQSSPGFLNDPGGANQFVQSFSPASQPGIAAGPDNTLGSIGSFLAPGGGTINNAVGGGTNGNWGGSLDKLSQILPAGIWNPSSQKRTGQSTASGGMSDHWVGNNNAYGIDLGLNSSFGGDENKATQTAIQILNNIRAQKGEPPVTSWPYAGSIYTTTTSDGYRIQLIWQSNVGGNHYDHIHIGVKNVGDNSAPEDFANNNFDSAGSGGSGIQQTQTTFNRTGDGGKITMKSVVDDAGSGNYGGPDPSVEAGGSTVGGSTPGDSDESTGVNDNMSPAFREQYLRVLNALTGTQFDVEGLEPPPSDGGNYGVPTGSKQEWAHLFTRMASVESSFNPNVQSGPSSGLYQLGQSAWNAYGGGGNIFDPNDNTNAFVRYAESLYFGTGEFAQYGGQNIISALGPTPEGYYGLAAGFGPFRKVLNGSQNKNESQLLAENILASERQTGNYSGGVGYNPMDVQDPHPSVGALNFNNLAAGIFSYPNPGAMLWVFFREGNPRFPVYFAASYGQGEWQSIYKYNVNNDGVAEDTFGYKPVATPEDPTVSSSGTMQFGPGAIRWTDHRDPNDATKDEQHIGMYHVDGSHVNLGTGVDDFYNEFDYRHITVGDVFRRIGGWLQQIIFGGYNLYLPNGNLKLTIGLRNETTRKSQQEIQDVINAAADAYSRAAGKENYNENLGDGVCEQEQDGTDTRETTPDGEPNPKYGEPLTGVDSEGNPITPEYQINNAISNENATSVSPLPDANDWFNNQQNVDRLYQAAEEFITNNNLTPDQAQELRTQLGNSITEAINNPGTTFNVNFTTPINN